MENQHVGNWLTVGGANVDIKGEPLQNNLKLGTSNPGIVHTSPGGVARNIAENLARLGEEVVLCSLVGEDTDGEWLRQTTMKSGVSTVGMLRLPNQRTGRYVSIHNAEGELLSAIADMAITDAWDEQHIHTGLSLMKKSTGVFLDANLPVEIIKIFLHHAKQQGKLIALDSVSVKKAERFIGLLDGITLLAPSRDEAAILTGMEVSTPDEVKKAAALLHQQGVEQVFITLGSEGVYIHHEQMQKWLPASKSDVLDVTGAGDAFTSGVMYGLTRTTSLVERAAYGIAMAGFALRTNQSVASTKPQDLEQAKEDYLREIGY